jgi:hypothetical protein
MRNISELNLVELTSTEMLETDGGFLPVVMLVCCFALGMSTALMLN